MTRIKAAISTVRVVPWFLRESWSYVGNGMEYIVGVVPALWRFMAMTYRDCRQA